MANKSKRTLISESLYGQLKEKGLIQEHYSGLVEDYLSYYDLKQDLFADIKDRGVMVPYNNGGGQSGMKKNESVAEVNKVTTTMLNILKELGLRGADFKDDDGVESM